MEKESNSKAERLVGAETELEKGLGSLAVAYSGEVLPDNGVKAIVFGETLTPYSEVAAEFHPAGRYNILKFKEPGNESLCSLAQVIQGDSYYQAGYVSKNGLDASHRLINSLDKSRGDNVTYYLTCSKPDRDGAIKPLASMRAVAIPEGGSLHDLPAFINSRGHLYDEDLQSLEATVAEYGTASVIEIAALSKTNEALPFASFELMRRGVTEAITDGSPEKWLMTLASPAYEALVAAFGAKAIRRIGENVMSFDSELIASSDLYLVPAVVEPKQCLRHILEGAYEKTVIGDLASAKKILFGFDYIRADIAETMLKNILGADGMVRWQTTKEALS